MNNKRISALAGCVLALGVLTACGGAPDFSGAGHGDVVVQVHAGDTAAKIGNTLKAAGVVKSVDAFVAAAAKDPKAAGIQPGIYHLKLEMSSDAALAVLDDPDKRIRNGVTVIEGSRLSTVIDAIVSKTKITRSALEAALKHPETLGLPAYAHNDVEGFLFPATYDVTPKETATELLQQMVAKAVSVQESLGITQAAAKLGMTPEQVVTMASLLQWEGKRSHDLPKIARVFYNRLAKPMRLQSDATVAYANGSTGTVWSTQAQLDNPSPYNTYVHDGLPPGPIGSPGEEALSVALNPADGPWLYFVPVNLDTGETVFSTTLAEHNAAVNQLRAWCASTTSPNCH
ncbi:ABC transporter substrate-binding protein [Nocardioides baekrokdamisoli]|uniref:Endolytic murein transglycosylase n=1 Tax=Nocardioides baekrokdamisoli TaxID=1804624 RepID=A0A3G9IRR2_9ACTN|nr:endolytic transglycosylase MltG [Nocardioides baekrokdamisoli]BBH16311.1 ABC transporter substrate-binding protein [Nocardioides baekrokdamisoli]